MSNSKQPVALYNYRGIDPRRMNNLQFAECQSESYAVGFDKVAAWVDASLDLYRPELSQMLYPLFVHSYLETVKQVKGMRACEMMRKHKARFVEAEGASVSISQELSDLSNVVYPQHLQNRVPKAVLSSKITIKISRYSLELLMNFLQRNEIWGLLGICNQYIRFDIKPQVQTELRPLEGLLIKDVGDEGLRINAQELHCGLLRGCLEDLLLTRMHAADGEPATARAPAARTDGGGDAGYSGPAVVDAAGEEGTEQGEGGPRGGDAEQAGTSITGEAAEAEEAAGGGAAMEVDDAAAAPMQPEAEKREGLSRKAAVQRAKERKAKAGQSREAELAKLQAERIEPTIPLRQWKASHLDAAVEQLRSCAALSASKPPSCCMFTFPQAAQSLNCMSASEDATLVATGNSRSELQLYDLRLTAAAPPPADDSLDGVSLQHIDPSRGCTHMWGHTGPVYGVCFSYDNRQVYSCSYDGTVRMWATEIGANLVVWEGHLLPVWDVKSCPVGHWLASGGADWTARLWCDERQECIRCFVGHQGDVDTLAWHPNSHLLVSGSATDRRVRVWDIKSGNCMRLFSGHVGGVSKVCVSPDGSTLAVGSHNGTVTVWDLRRAQVLSTLTDAHRGSVCSLSFSRSGQLLASGGSDCSLALWQPTRVDESKNFARSLFEEFPAVASCGPVPYKAMASYLTRSTPVMYLNFSRSNLLLAGGPRVPVAPVTGTQHR